MQINNLVRKIFVVTFILLCSKNIHAQYLVGGDLGVNIPTFNYNTAKVGFGITINGKYMLSDALLTGINLGFTTSAHKEYDNARIRVIPVTFLANYYLTSVRSKIRPYIGLDAGFYFTKTDILEYTIVKNGWGASVSNNNRINSLNKMKYGVAPVIGCIYMYNKEIAIDATLKYHMAFGGTLYSALAFQVGGYYLIGRFTGSKKGRRF